MNKPVLISIVVIILIATLIAGFVMFKPNNDELIVQNVDTAKVAVEVAENAAEELDEEVQ